MRFRFIRIGGRGPIEEVDYESIIRDCFAACTQDVKDKLEAFFKNKEEVIRFEFNGQTVKIRRDK